MSHSPIHVLLIAEPSAATQHLCAALDADPRDSFAVIVADRLDAGLDLLAGAPVDLLIVGIGLPESLAPIVAGAPETPVLAWLDADDAPAIRRAVAAGAADYLGRAPAEAALAGRLIRHVLERRHAQRERDECERRFFTLFHASPVAKLIASVADGRFLEVNAAFCRLIGYDREELIGRSLGELQLWADVADRERILRIWQQERHVTESELAVRARDGQVHTLLTSVTPMEFAGEDCFIAAMMDITARQQAELALRASEEQYRSLMKSLDSVVTTVDAAGTFQYMNEIAAAQLGGTPRDFIGRSIHELFPEPTASVQLRAIRQVIREDRGMHIESQSLVQGRLRWYRTTMQPIHDVSGQVICALINSTDIHDLKMIQQELLDLNRTLEERVQRRTAEVQELIEHLRRSNADLARAARAKDEFLATMSHELRTPLSAVLAFSESLQDGIYGPLSADQHAALQVIASSGQHLLDLINDILDLAKIEAGHMEVVFEPVPVADLCQASLQFVRELALKKSLRLAFQLNDQLAIIQADPRRLKQILVNLLSNAVKFTPDYGRVSLEVDVDAAAGIAGFTVVDSGIGIAPEDLPRLFQPFSQLDSSLSRRQEGSGLGLALVHRLTELHGGGVVVESAPGVGSRFTVNLPYAPFDRAAHQAGAPAAAAPAPSPAPAPRGRRVLLADDSEINIRAVGEYLRAVGYRVDIAHNGREAIDLAEQASPDLILMDIQMPELDGLEAIHRLRAQPAYGATPIIALTALAMPGDRERCLRAGADEYLARPVRLRDLAATIARLLGG